jgi:hypothetical protein
VSDLAAQVRERLGLAPDATDEQVTAALDARLGRRPPAGTGTSSTAPPTTRRHPAEGQTSTEGEPATGAPQGETLNASALERLIDSRVQALGQIARVAGGRDRAPPDRVDGSLDRAGELAARKEPRRHHRDALLDLRRSAPGRSPPRSGRSGRTCTTCRPGRGRRRRRPRLAAGEQGRCRSGPPAHAGDAEPSGDGFSDAEYAALFPDEKAGASVVSDYAPKFLPGHEPTYQASGAITGGRSWSCPRRGRSPPPPRRPPGRRGRHHGRRHRRHPARV